MSNRMKSFDRYATWATARRSAGMRASSVIIPQEQNYVLTLSIPSSHASRGRPPHLTLDTSASRSAYSMVRPRSYAMPTSRYTGSYGASFGLAVGWHCHDDYTVLFTSARTRSCIESGAMMNDEPTGALYENRYFLTCRRPRSRNTKLL
jgi:hypothetical protein